MTLGSSPMGMRWMTGWYFGAPCWFWNLRRNTNDWQDNGFCYELVTLGKITNSMWDITTRKHYALVGGKNFYMTQNTVQQNSSDDEPPGMVGGKHNALVHYVDVSAPNPSGIVICNPFK
ncbi:hypothetical protein FRACYDRAFT_254561 [Fragilariopsis cylindrus CCMP1102]|uniref:Uncharacterized protein n=1 Tax=Fragilariopsis cylindrus CCMP1102 TaxID=635003 RepID=A0A1E7EKU3_9STRA|nr:hypothetical protein FRACYDRAFT_254561 [Fragilariopsis cylindrus CCMP1102]|eukprot:OEU06540.1 hypothetical protein FRACYDRAFT_254561 [Fragilariopsis cylindrus CCMP1102]